MRPLRVAAGAGPLAGDVTVPGDKSLGHRALLLGALADGVTTVRRFSGGADVRATLDVVQRLGAAAVSAGDTVHVTGAGIELGSDADVTLECGNSGTTMRLAMGVVAGVAGRCVMDGDESLRRRPMERVAAPLRAMGARIETTAGRAPVTVRGGGLSAISWTLPIPSAQVKSAILLAGLRARGTTWVREPLASRDHTERMLQHMGVALARGADGIGITGGQRLRAIEIALPGDPSSAAFLVVAALAVPGSSIRIRDVGLNPTRIGAFEILRRMGASIAIDRPRLEGGEPCGDVVVRADALRGTTIRPDEVPAAIDELPILAVAGALAEGETRIAGAAELRLKESDRLAALEQLRALGTSLDVQEDGLVIAGSAGRRLRSARIEAHGDHRIAMAFAVAGLASDGGVTIDDPECVAVSFPGFFELLTALGATVMPA